MLWSSWYAASEICRAEREYWLSTSNSHQLGGTVSDLRRTFVPVWIERRCPEIHKTDLQQIAERHFNGEYRPVAVDFSDPTTREASGIHSPDPTRCEHFKKSVANLASSLAQTLYDLKDGKLAQLPPTARTSQEIAKTIGRMATGCGQARINRDATSREVDSPKEEAGGRGIDLLPETQQTDVGVDEADQRESPGESRGISLYGDRS